MSPLSLSFDEEFFSTATLGAPCALLKLQYSPLLALDLMMAVAVKIVAAVNELDADNVWTSAGWSLLNEMNIMQTTKFNFTLANMLEYFIHRKATDGSPTNDFKDVNTKAYPLFNAGHI